MVALVAATMSAMAQQVNYSVSGICADNGKKVCLIDQLTEKTLDSMIVANGKFSFSGTADKDALLALKVESKKWVTDFFNDGTPIVINVNDSTLKGSPLNERLTKLEIEQNIYNPQNDFSGHPKTKRDDSRAKKKNELVLERANTQSKINH